MQGVPLSQQVAKFTLAERFSGGICEKQKQAFVSKFCFAKRWRKKEFRSLRRATMGLCPLDPYQRGHRPLWKPIIFLGFQTIPHSTFQIPNYISPVVSSIPIIIFIHCTAAPLAPLPRLSRREQSSTWSSLPKTKICIRFVFLSVLAARKPS